MNPRNIDWDKVLFHRLKEPLVDDKFKHPLTTMEDIFNKTGSIDLQNSLDKPVYQAWQRHGGPAMFLSTRSSEPDSNYRGPKDLSYIVKELYGYDNDWPCEPMYHHSKPIPEILRDLAALIEWGFVEVVYE